MAISEPSEADCRLCDTKTLADGEFRGASADGSKAFFTTTQPLLGKDPSENLYEYDFNPPAGQQRVVRVSAGDGSVSEPMAEVQGVTNISEDGSRVYFFARGVLTTMANSMGEHARPGGENFYVWERDAEYPEGHTVFIAGCWDVGGERGISPAVPEGNGEAQVTPDGRFLVFTSACHLTVGDTSTARQVFLYDAGSGSMVRVSAGLEGYNDDGNVTGEDVEGGLDAHIVAQPVNLVGARGGALARSMSDDGSYVFFQSPVGLMPRAFNETQVTEDSGEPVYAQNVYEYHDGSVWLIGSDSSVAHLANGFAHVYEPVLLGVSASGGDVFFRTEDQLVGQDTDSQVDFYDARIDGGFPAPVTPAGCMGDACQGAPSAPPVFGVPSSAVFSGGESVAPVMYKPVVALKALTAAQKLSKALKVCAREPRHGRASCKARAKKQYGHTSRTVKSNRRGH